MAEVGKTGHFISFNFTSLISNFISHLWPKVQITGNITICTTHKSTSKLNKFQIHQNNCTIKYIETRETRHVTVTYGVLYRL